MSGFATAISKHRRVLASVASLTTASVVIATLAVVYQGVPTADVELDDGGVWVTSRQQLLAGHLNEPSRVLDGAVRARGAAFDVLQDGNTVLLHDQQNSTVSVLDPSTVALGDEVAVPVGSQLAFAGDTVAVLGDEHVWMLAAGSLEGATFDESAARWDAGAGGAVAVSPDAVVAVSAERREVSVFSFAAADAASGQPTVTALGSAQPATALTVTAVGENAVALDAKHGILYLPDGTAVPVPNGVGGVLQQAGPAADDVWVATPHALVRQPLSGGRPEITQLVPDGIPSAPVVMNGCTYAVWSVSAAYVRDCANSLDDRNAIVPGAEGSTDLLLRKNRRAVVVNDTDTGASWLINQDMVLVDDWMDVVPPPDETREDEKTVEEEQKFVLPERTAENRPPIATDDEQGVRAGRMAMVRVTENDSDADGDVLVASAVDVPDGGFAVSSVLGGAALQVTVPADATGAHTFTYLVDDGRGGTDDALVTLMVRPPEENSPPVQQRISTLQVESGATVGYDALEGWRDPDGDDVFLMAVAPAGGDTVTYRRTGEIEYTSSSGMTGPSELALTVSDGRDETVGALRVDIRPPGTLAPIANADRATTTAGLPVTIDPLANDLSPSGAPLRLAKLDDAEGAALTPDFAAGTFEFVAASPGIYYMQYQVTDGPASAVGLVRVDVVAATASSPIAVRDVALLPLGGEVLVDVLANDTDPGGGVLVVETATAADSGISVEVLQHRVLRITDLSGISEPVTVAYTVSNGVGRATGEMLVMPVPPAASLRAPVTVDDEAVVRAGDVVTIPVLANDYHPDGDTISLVPELVDPLPTEGVIFTNGDRVRYLAGDSPGIVYATYEVIDSQGNRTAGYVTIQVLPQDSANNSAPRPKAVTGRVLAGDTVRVSIPLDGVDADGDSVQLVGVGQAPRLGRVTVGDTWLTYEAYAGSSGSDSFTYVVRDRVGATAEGSIVVGVASASTQNQAPYADKDTVTVKPGRQVAVPVLANDTDPEGDDLALDPAGLTAPEGVSARVAGGRVLVNAPDAPGDYTFIYTVADPYGASAAGVLLVTVSPDAPLQVPVARDDRVATREVSDALTAEVAVLENDEDPDGNAADLTVSVDGASVSADGVVQVVIREAPQILLYTVTDLDGLHASAFIFVPGAALLLPQITTIEPVEVVSGQVIELPLAEHVRVREGREPRIALADGAQAAHAGALPLIVDERTLQYASAEGYFGPDAVTVLVTDGTGPDDPEGLSASISIPILVLPAQNQPPTLRDTTVDVAAGGDPASVDLAPLATDPDPGDAQRLTFAVTGNAPAGFRASMAGSVLRITAADNLRIGSQTVLSVTVSDGVNAPVPGAVTVRVVTSTLPLPVANDDTIVGAAAGHTERVAVLVNDYNPFPDEPLRVLSARVDAGQGTAVVEGDIVEVTPAAGFTGTLVVTYRIGDASGSTDREVDGRILATVQGRPDAPSTPSVTSIQDRAVVLSWGAPPNNGAPITGFTVTSSRGDIRACPATTCTIDGLTNDAEYTFTVVATNAIGTSEPSPPSAPARPDLRPATPDAPMATAGDRSLAISWTVPTSVGSPVLGYTVEISPAPAAGSAERSGVAGTSLVWDGLENGVSYRVRVQAQNRATEPSGWSAWSATQIPAGVPDSPGTPTASALAPVGSQAQLRVDWTAAADNGDAIADYTVTATGGDGVARSLTVPGDTTTATFTVGVSAVGYTFSVLARNKVGTSAPSAASGAIRATIAPAAPASVHLSTNYVAENLEVQFTPGALNGNEREEVMWRWSGADGRAGTVEIFEDDGSMIRGNMNGLANGVDQTVEIWGVSPTGLEGPRASSDNVLRPVGPLLACGQTVTRTDDSITISWDWSNSLNGNSPDDFSFGFNLRELPGAWSPQGLVESSVPHLGWDWGEPGLEWRLDGASAVTGWMKYTFSEEGSSGLFVAKGRAQGGNLEQSCDGEMIAPSSMFQSGTIGVWQGAIKTDGACSVELPCYNLEIFLGGFRPATFVSVDCYNSQGIYATVTVEVLQYNLGRPQNACQIGLDANNPWTGPYWAQARTPMDGTFDSNKDVSW
jgi:hypothetical protein